MKRKVTCFLNRRDIRQKLRRELVFGLFPKTLRGKLRGSAHLSFFLAGEEQRHFTHNAFNVLVNEGFLRNQQGVHTLEIVQKFYLTINRVPGRAVKVEKDILDVCPSGLYVLPNQAVITCVRINSVTKEKCYHAVRVSK